MATNLLKNYLNPSSLISNATPNVLRSLTQSSGTPDTAALTGSALGSLYGGGSLKSYNTDFTNSDAYRTLANAYGSSSSAANPIDLSGIIADYRRNNQATIDTLNKTLSDTISTLRTSNEQSRNDLLTSLKRFQETNAENMRTQQQDFNASRATLEDEAFMNQRNAAANAAARGLGGSGLQQLAQLQNRIAAGKNVSTLAQKNQNAQDALRKALAQETEDTNTKVSNLNKNLEQAIINAQNQTAAKINESNTNTTNLINNLIYNEQVRQRNAAAQAASSKAGLDSLLSQMKQGVTTLQGYQNSFESDLNNTVSQYLASKKKSSVSKLSSNQKKELSNTLNSLYNTYVKRVGGDLENYGNVAATYGLDNSYTDTAVSNLKSIYNKYRIK